MVNFGFFMVTMASTACLRCREQKLKCSREKPVCQRCARLRAKCGYPDPPDRKALAKSRAKQKKRQRVRESTDHGDESDQLMILSDRDIDGGSRNYSASTTTSIVSPPIQGIDETVGETCQRELVNVYFNSIWNARIFFDQDRFLEDLEQGRLPRYLVLAVCAVATQHLRPKPGDERCLASVIRDQSNLYHKGRRWAEIAAGEVLSGIDRPTITRIQACNVLDLYWLAAGEPERSLMFSNIAFVAASTWILDRANTDKNVSSTAGLNELWWQSDIELRRRCFWIVWIGNFIKADQQSVATFAKDRLLKLPLPRDNEAFPVRSDLEDINLADLFEGQRMALTEGKKHGGLLVELIQLVVIWTWVGSYLESRKSQSVRQTLPVSMDIDQSLSRWMENLPSVSQYSRRNLYEHLVVKQQPQYVWMHCLHHQCRLVLRSSLVPQFSGMTWSGEHHVETISISARIALKTACAISDIASDLLAIECDFGQMPPFVGYCMYASAAIHILFLFSRNVELSNTARTKLSSNIKVLEAMKDHWQSLKRLWARVTTLYEIQVSKRHDQASKVDTSIIIGLSNGDQSMSVVDEHAQHERDTGRLGEPLTQSMLTFNLRLQPRESDESGMRQFAAQQTYPDPLGHIRPYPTPKGTNGTICSESTSQHFYPTPHRSLTPSEGQEFGLPPSANSNTLALPLSKDVEPASTGGIEGADFAQYNFDQLAAAAEPGIRTESSLSFMIPEEDDWWNIDFDELNQTMMALGDNMDFSDANLSSGHL